MTAEAVAVGATLAISVWAVLCAVATLAAGRLVTRAEVFTLATPAAWFAVVVYAALKGWPS